MNSVDNLVKLYEDVEILLLNKNYDKVVCLIDNVEDISEMKTILISCRNYIHKNNELKIKFDELKIKYDKIIKNI